MTTTFENSKGYKVLPLSADEIKVWPRAKTCDRCGRKISSNGLRRSRQSHVLPRLL